MRRAVIRCSGVVQGVGFRPFVYRIAVRNGLKGYVKNLGDAGVEIVVEGEEGRLENFLKKLVEEKPPLALYERLDVKWEETKGLTEFKIEESDKEAAAGGFSNPPPDIATCEECLKELFTPGGRRYLYPFIVCSYCGPRFTIILDLPYDRVRTSMVDFPMCEDCAREYHDPLDRRHHAEPVCCWRCGPQMKLYSIDKEEIAVDDPLREAARLIKEGYVVGVKGIGGVHVAALATDDEVVAKLRRRKRRPQRPLAVMSRTLEQVKTYANVSKLEEELLTSFRRPILLLKKLEPFRLSELIAPGLDSVGAMLAYSGIHHVLLSHLNEPAVIMTSGNEPGEPMAIDNEAAFKQLQGIVDYLLLHNRRIVNRCDDSVVKLVDGKPNPIRRSRGYVMEPFKLSFTSKGSAIAVGAEENVTGAILKRDHCYPTQYIGDVDRLETYDYLASSLESLKRLLSIDKVEVVACDLHPRFLTRRLAKELAERFDAELLEVQHHHAHAASLMAEHGLGLDETFICIAADGIGYGLDGEAWGGEVLVASYLGFKRVGRLARLPMPGGDLCARYPARMLMSALSQVLGIGEAIQVVMSEYLEGFRHGEAEVEVVAKQLEKQSHPYTTSTGRVLDAASVMLKACLERTYEGEPAIKLEALASSGDPSYLDLPVRVKSGEDNCMWLDTPLILVEALDAYRRGARRADVAAAVQEALAKGLALMAIEAAEKEGIKAIGFSGGVAYNDRITRKIREMVEARGLRFYRHIKAPSGDGGISLGQVAIAAARLAS
ncbi:MAG: carbamoyltransferase HypF [Thermoprotei archaeon]|nr:MAG: carbamoyltransferase HypF [Thermoprotei archaeon]